MFAKRREVEKTFSLIHGPPAKNALCLAADAVEKDFRLAVKEWGPQIIYIDADQEKPPPAIDSTTEVNFNVSEWLAGDTEEYDDDGQGGQVKHQHFDRKPFHPFDDTKVLLYTCAACGNVNAHLSRCSMCTTKYCDASWYVVFHFFDLFRTHGTYFLSQPKE